MFARARRVSRGSLPLYAAAAILGLCAVIFVSITPAADHVQHEQAFAVLFSVGFFMIAVSGAHSLIRFSHRDAILPVPGRNVPPKRIDGESLDTASIPASEPSVAVEIFVARENVERYREKLRTVSNETDRRTLEILLAEEESRLQALSQT